MFNLYQYFYIL